jgi:hypothetical protein
MDTSNLYTIFVWCTGLNSERGQGAVGRSWGVAGWCGRLGAVGAWLAVARVQPAGRDNAG